MSDLDLAARKSFAPMPTLPARGPSGSIAGDEELGLFGRFRSHVTRLSDVQLAMVLSGILFVLAAWPLCLTELPPYQDLPNHLAAVTVIQHPERYPDLVSNGFLKTNAALFTWLCFVGRVIGVNAAARTFALLVLAANALVLPRFVLHFTRSRKALAASALFAWPMIHNWFVSMGMLDFAMGVPLALVVLMLLDAQRKAPTLARGALVVGITLCTWYAHVFALMVVHLLTLVHVVEAPDDGGLRAPVAARVALAKRLFVPQIPAMVLVAFSLYQHVTEPVGAMTGYVATGKLLPAWELAYNLWAEWMYGFTWLSVATILPTLALAWFAFRRRTLTPTFFSPAAFLILLAFFVFTPYIATNWFHVNSRFAPFLWMAALLRVPERLDKRLASALAFAAATYTVGMGIDFVRLDHDRAKFTAGIAAVPEGSQLLPLVFRAKGTSENTRSLLHAWGFYVTEKQTSAPLLFAHSRSFPVMYKEPPPPQFNHLVLESFAPSMGTPQWFCDVLRSGGVYEANCEGAWRAEWKAFWDQARPRFDHVLMWDAPVEAIQQVPSDYEIAFQQDKLIVLARKDPGNEAPRASFRISAPPPGR